MSSLLDDFLIQTGERPTTDEELLAFSVARPSLFQELVERYQEAFLRKAQRIVARREEAEDVVQETFTKIYLNASRFEVQEGARFSSWAYTILIHTACSHYKKQKRERGVRVELDPEIFELVPDIEERLMERTTMRDAVASTLSLLPQTLARALEAHFLDDRPQKDIAEEEGVGVGVIKTRVLRAKAAFRKVAENLNTI